MDTSLPRIELDAYYFTPLNPTEQTGRRIAQVAFTGRHVSTTGLWEVTVEAMHPPYPHSPGATVGRGQLSGDESPDDILKAGDVWVRSIAGVYVNPASGSVIARGCQGCVVTRSYTLFKG